MTQEHRKHPWLFYLESDGIDMLFRRVPADFMSNPKEVDGDIVIPWGLYGETDPDSPPWKVLIFVKGNTPSEEIMHEINKAQTYWREQTEKQQQPGMDTKI